MADVAAAFRSAGFESVRTILASGNVLLETADDGGAASVRSRAEAILRSTFGYQAWVLAYPVDGLRRIADAYPFPGATDRHSYVTFVSDPAMLDELAALAPAGPQELIARGDGVIYWQAPKTATLETTIGKTMGSKRYRSSTTSRNLRTLDKVLQAAEA